MNSNQIINMFYTQYLLTKSKHWGVFNFSKGERDTMKKNGTKILVKGDRITIELTV